MRILFFLFAAAIGFFSCGVVNKSSIHGFDSGTYQYRTNGEQRIKVYCDISEDSMVVYRYKDEKAADVLRTVPFSSPAASCEKPVYFVRHSLDIDFSNHTF